MSDVREAAERLREHSLLPHVRTADGRPYFEGDLKLLANAYLAEHPSDDDELITDDWWRDMSGGCRFIFSPDERLMLWLGADGMLQLCISDGGGDEISRDMPHIKTRGDVRRLCKALGVEVKE